VKWKKEKKTLQPSPPQAVWQEEHHPSPQSPEYQKPISGLDAKGISPELLQSTLNFFILLHLAFFFFLYY
jgi:hypothetical protein